MLWGSGNGVDAYLRADAFPLPVPLARAGEGTGALLHRLRHCMPLRPALHFKSHILHPAQLPGSG